MNKYFIDKIFIQGYDICRIKAFGIHDRGLFSVIAF
jgi:hypothetical protein